MGTAAPLTYSVADGYVIGDPGRAAAEVGAGFPAGVPGWPDTAVDAAEVAGMHVRAASVRGIVHRKFAVPRQDSYSMVWKEDSQTLVVAVCDGLGSFDRSHEAADLAATRLPELVDEGWQDAFDTVSAEIAQRISVSGAQMATTAICARLNYSDEGIHRAELASVGDSAAYLLGPDGWRRVAGAVKTIADDDTPLSSGTAALPAQTINLIATTVEFGSDTALFLMTDGVADPLGAGSGEVGRVLGQWWAQPPNEFEFGAQAAFARRSFDDDRTVVGVWPNPQVGTR